MTSPKITAENKTTANAATAAAAAAATEVSNGAVAGTSAPVATDNAAQNDGPAAGLFSWLKIFRLANLMIKQGC